MPISSTTYSKDNPPPDGKWRFKKGERQPRWVCPICDLDTTISTKNRHNCGGSKFDHDDYEEIRLYRIRLDNRARIRGDECTLTTLQIAQLLDEAGIDISQLGRYRGCYHLARYNDTGNYEWGNCRFVTISDNIREQKNATAKACIIDGIEYPSRSEAARAIGMAASTVQDRINSAKWANYNWKRKDK